MVTLEASLAEAKAQLSAAIKNMNSSNQSPTNIRRPSIHSSDSPFSDENSPQIIRKNGGGDNNSVQNSVGKNSSGKNSPRKSTIDSFEETGIELPGMQSRIERDSSRQRMYSNVEDDDEI